MFEGLRLLSFKFIIWVINVFEKGSEVRKVEGVLSNRKFFFYLDR